MSNLDNRIANADQLLTQVHTHTHTHTFTQKKAKCQISCHKGSRVPGEARTPMHQAGTVCRCCAVSWISPTRARNSQEHQLCLVTLQVWAPEVPPTNILVINFLRHSQCTLLPSTRPGTRFTDAVALVGEIWNGRLIARIANFTAAISRGFEYSVHSELSWFQNLKIKNSIENEYVLKVFPYMVVHTHLSHMNPHTNTQVNDTPQVIHLYTSHMICHMITTSE